MNYLSLLYGLYKSNRNVHKSKEKIIELQNKSLKAILKHAYHHSAYYHRTFEAAGINEENIEILDITAFPCIDKKQFVQHFDEIVTGDLITQNTLRIFDEEKSLEEKTYAGKYHLVHSSGSTGKPAYFIYDEKAWNQMLIGIIRSALWDMSIIEIFRLLTGGLRILYIAATDGRYGGAMAVGAGIEGLHAEQLFLDINLPVSEWITKIEEFKPNIVIGYPSAIKILAELVEEEAIQLDVTRVISCGEPLNIGLRKYLEEHLQATVINIYGASESLAIGVESSAKEGMYLFDDLNYIEIENDAIYLTSLYNYAQPLIRYRITDHLKIKETDFVHYPFTLIENILGRNEDLMWFEDEAGQKEFLHPLAIEGFTFEGMLDFQFHQINHYSFEMLIQIVSTLQHEVIEKYMQQEMQKILNAKHLGFVKFFIKFVDEIYPDQKTGKKRLIVREQMG